MSSEVTFVDTEIFQRLQLKDGGKRITYHAYELKDGSDRITLGV